MNGRRCGVRLVVCLLNKDKWCHVHGAENAEKWRFSNRPWTSTHSIVPFLAQYFYENRKPFCAFTLPINDVGLNEQCIATAVRD